MNKLFTILLFLSLAAGVAAADDDGFVGPNLLRGNDAVTIYKENKKGIPTYIEGIFPDKKAVAGREVETALSFFEEHKGAFRMTAPVDELQTQRIDADELGMRHVRFQQVYQGLPVVGGELIVHFGADGLLKTVNGNYEPGIKLDVTPAIVGAEAVRIAQDDLKSFFGDAEPGEPVLVVFPWAGTYNLCWRLFLYSDTPMGRWEYLIDAKNGDVLFKANRIMNTDAIGTGIGVMGSWRYHIDTDFNGSNYRMIDFTRQLNNDPHGHKGQMPDGNYLQTNVAGATLPGTVATDADNVWDDPNNQSPAVDGHVYSALVYDWMLREFLRNSYDNAGASMLTIVNYSGEGDNNAYWDGSRIVIWSWSSGWRSLAGCPDVIAHEWGHAVTEYTSGLIYQLESGALNESFSDMMGAAFEFAHDTLDTPDWYMGENGQIGGTGFRNMANPHEFGDPDYYGTSDPYWVDVENCTPDPYNDWCGVHTNSGVGNKWFQLLSDGGTHYGVTVNGIGVVYAIRVAYRANAYYWTSSTDYHNAALGTISAADDLDTTGAWAAEVNKAWQAVGVATPGPGLAFSYPNGVPNVLTPAESTTFDVVVSGTLGGVPVSGSGQLHYSIDGGAYVTVPMTEISTNYYRATLPAGNCDSKYYYYVSADEETNGTFYDPDTTNPFWAIVADSAVIVFEDNFETDKGWTVSGDATDGQWDRGVPVGGGDRGDPPTDFDGSGKCYLTDNVDGNSDVDGGTTILTSPIFDLTGEARIHYARWYSNNFGNAPYSDIFEVYLSNDSGATWTLVEQVGPIQQASGGWYEHSFWVSDLVTPGPGMQMRFEASDLGDGSVVEAAVDAFSVTQYQCNVNVPQIITTSLPDWTVNAYYSQQLEASGGVGILTWNDKFGDLAGTGLSLSATGLLSGTPLDTGTITFTALVTDDASQTDERQFSFYINEQIVIVTGSLPDWTVNQPYSQQLQATGGTGTKTWSDLNGDLAGTGLSLAADGLLSGTPVDTGVISFTARVSDQGGDSREKPYSFTINPVVTITTDSLPAGVMGQTYSHQLVSTGGTGTITWSDKNNNLSGTGLSLSADGLLSGTPVDTGTVNFTARAQDLTGSADEKLFSVVIEPPYICGDVDGDSTGPNVADLTYLVDYLFRGGQPPPIPEAADVDGSSDINISDVTGLIDFLFRSGQLNCIY
jgi:thermolysin